MHLEYTETHTYLPTPTQTHTAKYIESEELADPSKALDRWEAPGLGDIQRGLRGLQASTASAKLHMQTVQVKHTHMNARAHTDTYTYNR